MARVLLNVPKTARRGDPVAIRVLISHPMESGQRRDEAGRPIPRQVIHSFACTYNGAEVVRLVLHPAVAANPSTPTRELQALVRDPDRGVVRSLADNPNAPTSVRRRARRRAGAPTRGNSTPVAAEAD